MKLRDEELTGELRAMRPEIDPDFGAELDAWAAEGFPPAGPEPKRSRPRGLRLRPLLPRLAVAASVLLALVVSVSVLSTVDGGSDDSGGDSAGQGSIESAPSSGQDSDGGAARESIEPAPTTLPPEPPAPPREQLKPGQERIQERSASMTLSADPDEVAEVADGVVEVTERYDGIVVSSEVDTGGDRARASFDLRVPTQNLQAALADLSDLASVAERNEGTLDVTARFVSAEERFADAKAEVDALVEQLGEADSADEIAQIRAQLQVARGELAAARSELRSLKQRADFSTLGVTVVGDGDADGWTFGDAIDDAGSVLEDLGGATIVALAVIVPLGLVAAALWFGLGAARRRTRERALDD
jgi:hypothetical protein